MDTRNFLELALKEAEKALKTENYPFGAVIVDKEEKIVSTGHNENFSLSDISAHAEIQCLRKIPIQNLLDKNKSYTLFCSGESCGGCSFFISRTNIKKVYWALTDPQKAGFADFKNNEEMKDSFIGIETFEEPHRDLKEKSADLLKKYYLKNGNPEKANLY